MAEQAPDDLYVPYSNQKSVVMKWPFVLMAVMAGAFPARSFGMEHFGARGCLRGVAVSAHYGNDLHVADFQLLAQGSPDPVLYLTFQNRIDRPLLRIEPSPWTGLHAYLFLPWDQMERFRHVLTSGREVAIGIEYEADEARQRATMVSMRIDGPVCRPQS